MSPWTTLVDSLQGKRQKQTYLARLARMEGNKRRTERTNARVIDAIRELNCACTSEEIAHHVGLSVGFTRKVLARLEGTATLVTQKRKVGTNWVQYWEIYDGR